LHALELVDHRLRLGGGELRRISAAGARQTVPAGEVAGVGELPGQADRCVEAAGEVLDERHGHAHPTRSRSMCVSASRAMARSYAPMSDGSIPALVQAARAVGASPRAWTTASRRRSLRNDSRRVPKW